MPYGEHRIYVEPVTTTTSTATVELGAVRREGYNTYVYAYNGCTSTIITGAGVVASLFSAGTVSVSSVTGHFCVGVAKTEIGVSKYGWICTYGPCNVEIGDTVIGNHTAATGVGIALMTNGLFYGVTTGATGSTWANTVCGHTLTSIATNASGTAFLTIRA